MSKKFIFSVFVICLITANVNSQVQIEKNKVVYFYKNECKDIDAALIEYEKLFEYQNLNQPRPQTSRCGQTNDGNLGCVVVTNSVEDYEMNVAWQETDDIWNNIIRDCWKICGVDDFSFQLDIIQLK